MKFLGVIGRSDIPPWQVIHQWIPRRQSRHNDFSSKVHLLVGKLVLVVAIHSLGGSRANWHHTPNPQPGVVQPIQDEDHTSHEQSTRVPFGSPPRKGQEPLTITTIGARDNHQPPLYDHRCSKPSMWWQPPRVTSQTRSETRISSASRCKHWSNALGFSLNLIKMLNQWSRWMGGLWLSSQGFYVNANGQESELELAMGLKYKSPQNRAIVLLH